jgi:hypothetical protein
MKKGGKKMMRSGGKFGMLMGMAGLVLTGALPLHAVEVMQYKSLVDPEDAGKCVVCHYGQEDSKVSTCVNKCLIDPESGIVPSGCREISASRQRRRICPH